MLKLHATGGPIFLAGRTSCSCLVNRTSLTSFHAWLVALWFVCCSCGCSRSPLSSALLEKKSASPDKRTDPWFEEVAARAGVAFMHSSGHVTRFYMPESM